MKDKTSVKINDTWLVVDNESLSDVRKAVDIANGEYDVPKINWRHFYAQSVASDLAHLGWEPGYVVDGRDINLALVHPESTIEVKTSLGPPLTLVKEEFTINFSRNGFSVEGDPSEQYLPAYCRENLSDIWSYLFGEDGALNKKEKVK